jgi:DASS family divalent anion:Na+ symporter
MRCLEAIDAGDSASGDGLGDTSATGLVEPVPSEPIIGAAHAREAATHRGQFDWLSSRAARLLALVAIYGMVVLAFPRPVAVSPDGWRITALFLSTIAGLMIQPLPGAALVIISLTLFVLVGGLPASRVLAGFSSPSVWLVLTAMLMSRALRDTGLSRRIALVFVRLFGGTSLGVSYSLVLSDVTLAAGIPSITARSGGIVLPVARSIAELYQSTPGPTAARLGTFLMTALYQGSAIACAMFMTGQASNVLVAGFAAKLAGTTVTWSSWFIAGLVPGLVSCAVVPYVVMRMLPPDIRRTPAAAAFARSQLNAMGSLTRNEWIALGVFIGVCGLWMTSGWHHLDVAVVAMAALGILFLTNVLSWETALREQSAWDVFVWYGGLLTMGEVLNETGSTTAFANWVGGSFTGMDWFVVLLLTLLIYFYAHYAFASITAHALAMFPPFVVMLIGLGTPPLLAVYSLACIANLTAGLTHYGTTTAPIVFAEKYVSFGDWWRVGFVVSVVNLTIWLTVGFAWWKVLGFW